MTLFMWMGIGLLAVCTLVLLVATFAEERAVRQGR